MPITLSVQTYRGEPVAQPFFQQFDPLGGTIGRAVGNALVLEDPSKYISRNHARIEFRNDAYCLTDLGSNPSVINDRPLGTGKSMVLQHGDSLVIGDYRLMIAISGDHVPAALPPSPLQVQAAQVQPLATGQQDFNPGDSLASAKIFDLGLQAGGGALDPLGLNLFSPEQVVPDQARALQAAPIVQIPAFRGTESDHVPPQKQAFQLPPAVSSLSTPPSTAMAIPDDYDPLADLMPARAQVQAASSVPQTAPNAQMAPPTVAAAPITHATESMLQQSQAAALTSAQNSASSSASSSASNHEVMQALMRGLGLPPMEANRSATEQAELAELVGAMLREATEGTMGVLMARAMTKRESRMEMTMISNRSNNPLKFFPDAGSALTQMLGNTMPGYMPPVRAFSTAFDDLKAHELAMMAGMRAALDGVLHRFDPAAIEERLKVPTVMDKVLMNNRKAKMWDRLVELYAEISREADDDFQRLFGEQFASAYEEQIKRLRMARK